MCSNYNQLDKSCLNRHYELHEKLVQCQSEMKTKEKLIKTKESEISALQGLCSTPDVSQTDNGQY